jgi:cell division protease FtsH
LTQGRDFSETTARQVDRDIQQRLQERHETARQLLTGARDKLDDLVKALLQEETIDQAGLARILGPRPKLAMEVSSVA